MFLRKGFFYRKLVFQQTKTFSKARREQNKKEKQEKINESNIEEVSKRSSNCMVIHPVFIPK